MRLGQGNAGSLSMTVVASMTAIAMASLYVVSGMQKAQKAVREGQQERAREAGMVSGASDLSTIKSLLSTRKVGKNYEPALYPQNYYAQAWEFAKNDLIKMQTVAVKPGLIDLKSFGTGESTMDKALPVFAGGSSTNTLTMQQTHKLLAYNADLPAHPYYIKSIDVAVDRPMSDKDARSMRTIGRIYLDAPVPFNAKVYVKGPGQSTFSDNLGTAAKPLPGGHYTIQLKGSGVVLNGEVVLDGKSFPLGMDKNGNITHQAVNVKAADAVIGEFETDILPKTVTTTKTTTSSTGSGSPGGGSTDEKCTIGGTPPGANGSTSTGSSSSVKSTTTTTVTKSETTAVSVSAKLYGVDDQVSDVSKLDTKIYVGGDHEDTKQSTTIAGKTGSGTGTVDTANPKNLACNQYCPLNINGDFNSSPSKKAIGLDNGIVSADFKKTDFYDPALTASTIGPEAAGITCGNHDLVAKAMSADTGMLPTALLSSDPGRFDSEFSKYASMRQNYAYVAPVCAREVINDREGCGCFAADTQIRMGDGTTRIASAIRRGDRLWNPQLKRAETVIRVVRGPELVPLYKLEIGGRTMQVTSQHPFLTTQGLKAAKDLSTGDTILEGQGTDTVDSIVQVPPDAQNPPVVWNFELAGDSDPQSHYVEANGVMTGDLYLQEQLAKKSSLATKVEP